MTSPPFQGVGHLPQSLSSPYTLNSNENDDRQLRRNVTPDQLQTNVLQLYDCGEWKCFFISIFPLKSLSDHVCVNVESETDEESREISPVNTAADGETETHQWPTSSWQTSERMS